VIAAIYARRSKEQDDAEDETKSRLPAGSQYHRSVTLPFLF
jgi:HSP20 family molecular chaperone IbpA